MSLTVANNCSEQQMTLIEMVQIGRLFSRARLESLHITAVMQPSAKLQFTYCFAWPTVASRPHPNMASHFHKYRPAFHVSKKGRVRFPVREFPSIFENPLP